MMGIFKKTYNKEYYENFLYRGLNIKQRDRKRLREILLHKKGGILLEIGCGKGQFLLEAEKRFDIEGIDISLYAVNIAKKIFKNRVKKQDIVKENLIESKYDIVAAFNVLEHIRLPKNVVLKIYRSLKNDGILIGSVPNNSSIIGSMFTRFSNFTDKSHISTYPPDIWITLFKDVGFRHIKFFGEIALHREIGMYIKNPLWKHMSFNLVFVCRK